MPSQNKKTRNRLKSRRDRKLPSHTKVNRSRQKKGAKDIDSRHHTPNVSLR